MNVNEIKQGILDLLILNGRKPQTIKSGERVVYLYDALNIVNKEFSKIEQPQLNENQQYIEGYVEMAIVQLREANLILNKVYEKDSFAREIQNDISEIMDTLNYRYFGEQEEE